MNIVASQVGIDVSKDELVVSIDRGKAFSVINDEEAALELAGSMPKGAVVHLESSGGYERIARRVLSEKGFDVRIHNPLKCRRLAQAQGVRAKTDPVDAQALSRSGVLLPCSQAKSLQRQGLADISRTIESIKLSIAQFKTRLQVPDLDAAAVCALQEVVTMLKAKVNELESTFQKRVALSSYGALYELGKSIPNVGPVTMRVIICELPEDFAGRDGSEIASYAGVAPLDDSSGRRKGHAHVGRGNHRLKKCLYMPALCAIAREAWAKDLYARLKAKGKSHQTAAIAVMRRLLLRILAVLKRGSAWQPSPPNPLTT